MQSEENIINGNTVLSKDFKEFIESLKENNEY